MGWSQAARDPLTLCTSTSNAQFIDRKTTLLEAMRRGNKSEVLLQGKRLLGLGSGFTHSGDDWLAGMMLVSSLHGSLLELYRNLWPLLVSNARGDTGRMGRLFYFVRSGGCGASMPLPTCLLYPVKKV